MKKACVIGWPVAHSRSPLIHGYWLRQYGIAGEYIRQPVEPAHLAQFIASMQSLGFAGGNVTVPHKEEVFRLAGRRDAAAESVAAANTIWFEDGQLCVSNTDVHGFLANLDEEAPGWDARAGDGAAVVLGAGGAARGIVRGLLNRGFARIYILNRTQEKAAALTSFFGPAVTFAPWEHATAVLKDAVLLVNATTLGMTGQPPLSISLEALPVDAVISDIVYDPLETPMLAAARARGNKVSGGLGMLLHQAVPGFECWFGIRPDVTPELRALIAADVEGRRT